MNNLKERIMAYIAYKGLTAQAFEKSAGLSNAAVSKMGDGTRRVTLDKISNAYKDLNISWVLTGEGEMIKHDSNEEIPRQASVPMKSLTKGVPYYDVDFIGGFDIVINDQTTRPDYFIDYRPYNKATCWCNITGQSMEPVINSGDMLALQEIIDWEFLVSGEIYAIVTTNGLRTVKRVIVPRGDNDHFILKPENDAPEYVEQEIPKRMISRVYKVLGCMKRL